MLPLILAYWVEFHTSLLLPLEKPAFFKAGLVENSFFASWLPYSLNSFQTAQLAQQTNTTNLNLPFTAK